MGQRSRFYNALQEPTGSSQGPTHPRHLRPAAHWQTRIFSQGVILRRKRCIDPDTLRASFDLASVYFAQNDFQNAERLNRQVADVQARTIGRDHPDTLATLNNLGAILLRQQRYEEAAALNADLLQTRRRVLGETHPDTLRSLHQLGVSYMRLGRLDEAERLLISAKEGRRRIIGETHPGTILTISRLADLYVAQRRYEDAESQLLNAAEVLHLDGRSSSSASAFYAEGSEINIGKQLSELYRVWGQKAKAAEWSAKLTK